jgi:hypothetical protein
LTHSLKISTLVFVRSFYVENATFFLIVIGLAGGFMSGAEHQALAEFFMSEYYVTLIPVGLWILYGWRILSFNKGVLIKKENQFINDLAIYPSAQRLLAICSIAINQLAPAIIYGIFLLATALKFQAFLPALVVVAGLIVTTSIVSISLQSNLLHPGREKKISLVSHLINRYITRPYPLFVIEWISRKHTVLLFTTKIFSSLILLGVLKLYSYEQYDARLVNMTLMIIMGISVQLVGVVHQFENIHFPLVNQLPLRITTRMLYVLPAFAFILFPEIGILISRLPRIFPPRMLVESIVFMLSFQFLAYGLLFKKHMDLELLLRRTFVVAMTTIVVILFRIPIWVPSCVFLALGLFFWNRYFYRYEISQ